MAKEHKSGKGYRPRRVDVRGIRQRFLIVCEGLKTEPAYFEGFRGLHVVLKIEGGDSDPIRLVENAFVRWQQSKADYDQVWCVFDRDDVPPERFVQALKLAKQREIRVAYSNQAFELWFLLHFQDCTGALTRQDYIDRLNRQLGRPYKKNDPQLFAILEPQMEAAINRAKRLMEEYVPCHPVEDDPSTSVHTLVEELLRFSQR